MHVDTQTIRPNIDIIYKKQKSDTISNLFVENLYNIDGVFSNVFSYNSISLKYTVK